MSTLVLVRHAQGSLFTRNYDRLSELGQEQAGRLGEHWARQRMEFDVVFTGPAERHRDTERLARERAATLGVHWPEPTVVDDLDEHDAAGFMKGVLPQVHEKRPDLHELIDQALAKLEDKKDRQRVWEKLFVEVMAMWLRGDVGVEGIETWPEFKTRVRRGLDHVMEGAKGKRIAVYSSVGPSAVTLQRALDSADQVAYDIAWRLLNCSVSSFVFDQDRMTLDGLNAVPHLDPDMWTTR